MDTHGIFTTNLSWFSRRISSTIKSMIVPETSCKTKEAIHCVQSTEKVDTQFFPNLKFQSFILP